MEDFKDKKISFDTERFQTIGESIRFLKKYSKENYDNNNGLNILSNNEVLNIVGYLEYFLNKE
jgi:hypothetical protein